MKHCHKCKKDFSEENSFCGECGGKLTVKEHKKTKKEVEKHYTPKNEKSTYKFSFNILTIISILIVIAAAILLPTKVASYEVPYIDTEQYTVEVPYEDVEEYTVQVPYEVEETYVESIPVQEQENYIDTECNNVYLTYNVEYETCRSANIFSNGETTVSLFNSDSKTGTWKIKVGYNKGGNFFSDTITKTVNPGRTETLTYSHSESNIDTCQWKPESTPTKQVCTPVTKQKTVTVYKDVVKTKTVTKYRDETRYRKVTNTRIETREKEVRKTRTEQKEVNWLFGFNAIIKFRKL